MGLFDKWKPKTTPVLDKNSIDQTVNKGLDNINREVSDDYPFDFSLAQDPISAGLSVKTQSPLNQGALNASIQNGTKKVNETVTPGTNRNLQTVMGLKPVLDQQSLDETVNGGLNTINRQVQPGTPENKKALDLNAEGEDFLSGLAPLSQEEEESRARQAEAVMGIGNFSNSLAALANVFAVGAGARSQTMPTIQNPDIQAYLEKGRQQRQNYALMQQQQKQQAQEMKMKQDAADRQAEFDKQMQPLKIALAKEQINTEQFKAMAQMYGASKEQAEAAAKQVEAEWKPKIMQSEVDKNNASASASRASAANSIASANLHKTEQAIKTNADNTPFYSEKYGTVNISKKSLEANIGYVHSKTGESEDKEAPNGYGKVKKSPKEMMNDISRHQGNDEVIEAIKNVAEGKKAQEQKEKIDY